MIHKFFKWWLINSNILNSPSLHEGSIFHRMRLQLANLVFIFQVVNVPLKFCWQFCRLEKSRRPFCRNSSFWDVRWKVEPVNPEVILDTKLITPLYCLILIVCFLSDCVAIFNKLSLSLFVPLALSLFLSLIFFSSSSFTVS